MNGVHRSLCWQSDVEQQFLSEISSRRINRQYKKPTR